MYDRQMQLELRPVEPGDAGFLKDLIVAAVAEETGAWMWPEPMRAQLLDMQYRARLLGTQNAAGAIQQIALLDEDRVAWRVVIRDLSHLHLADIIVSAERRGAGIGSALIQELMEEANREHIALRLMVSVMNQRALRLYERLGFTRTGGSELQHEMTYFGPNRGGAL